MLIDSHTHIGTGPREHTVDDLLQMMDTHGADRVVAFPGPHGLAGSPGGIAAANDYIAHAARRHPTRITGFATVNPFHDEAWDEIDRAAQLGLRGLKLHPPLQGLTISDSGLMDPLLERATALGWPVVIHSGPTPAGLAYVILNLHDLKGVALAHPEATLVLAHMGWGGRDAGGLEPLVRECANVWFDTSGVSNPEIISQVAGWGGRDRILYGSDYPFLHPKVELLKVNMAALPPEDEEKVLSGNAARLLGLDKEVKQ